MTREERKKDIIKLLSEASEMMQKKIETGEIPPSGKFVGHSIGFRIKETENIGLLICVQDPLNKVTGRRLSLAAQRIGSSYKIEIQIFKGSTQELKEFLNFTSAQFNEYADKILELSDDADDRDDRFMK